MPRDCITQGHVLVDDDELHECLACNEPVAIAELVALTVHREHDEMQHPDDVAIEDQW